MSVFTIGIEGSLLNVPGTWPIGTPLMAIAGVGWMYLGFIPRLGTLSRRTCWIFAVLFTAAGLYTAVALFEGLFLFPRFTSIQGETGLSLYALGVAWLGVGLLSTFLILGIRAIHMPKSYVKQQLGILLLFVGLGVLPSVLLTLLPRSIADVVILPFPVTLSLLILVPAGYFFVIYRRGYLGLDLFFSRALTLITLVVVMMAVYGSALAVLRADPLSERASLSENPILPAMVVFLPTLVLAVYLTDRIDIFVQNLLFGKQVIRADAISEFANALSANPEHKTLGGIIQKLANNLNIACAALVLTNEQGYLVPVAQVDVPTWDTFHINTLDRFVQPLVRAADQTAPQKRHALFDLLPWGELFLPVVVRTEQIGFLAMARPLPDGFFNAKQVSFLSRVADIIAVGSEAIHLFESARKLSKKLLHAQEVERQQLATLIHERPLQTINMVANKIDDLADDVAGVRPSVSKRLKQGVGHLQAASEELRQICAGLYPPVIDFGVEMVIQEVAYEFRDKYGLNIDLKVALPAGVYYPSTISAVIYRVATEALNNVVKHADTNDTCVTLSQNGRNTLSLVVADTGRGCDLPQLSETEFLRQRHFGIVGMLGVAERVDGKLMIARNQPRGTKVVLEIPLAQYDGGEV